MLAEDAHKPLRDDVRLLGRLLGDTLISQEGADLFGRVERVRAAAKAARGRDRVQSDRTFAELADELSAMPVESAVPIARAFSHFLQLANVAEQHHRIRRRRAHQRDSRGGRSRVRSKRSCRAWRRRRVPIGCMTPYSRCGSNWS